jgi:hypothetical protein
MKDGCDNKPNAVLLVVLCLLLCIASCRGQRRVVTAEMDILRDFYDITGGNSGAWNFTRINNRILSYNKTEYDYYDPGLVGRDWSFMKSVEGTYVDDPCPTATTLPFTGVNCSCDATECHISALVVPRGNLTASTIPPELGSLRHLTFMELAENKFYGKIPIELMDLSQLRILDLKQNKLTGSIPASLDRLKDLEYLFLWANRLNGKHKRCVIPFLFLQEF